MFRCFYNAILFSLHETSNLHFTPLHLSKASHCRSHRPPSPPPRWDLARRHVLCISYCDSHLVLKWNSRLIIPTLWFCRGAGAVLSRSYTSNNLKRRSKQAHLIDHKALIKAEWECPYHGNSGFQRHNSAQIAFCNFITWPAQIGRRKEGVRGNEGGGGCWRSRAGGG